MSIIKINLKLSTLVIHLAVGWLISIAAPLSAFERNDNNEDKLPSIAEVKARFFPNDSQFIVVHLAFSEDDWEVIKETANVRVKPHLINAFHVEQSGVALGWIFIDKVIGKHELITYALVVDNIGVIKGVEILEYLETYGGQVKQAQWRQQFYNKALNNSPLKLGKDIDGVSGATLSCRNVTDGIRKLLIINDYLNKNSSF